MEDFYARNGRHAILAVDGTLWIVEIEKAAKEHYKVALFNRILTYYALGLEIVMVFDGPNKIAKHGRVAVGKGIGKTDPVKMFCEWMGLKCVIAESEGEAACAWLQRENIADFVFTGDSDSLVYQANRIVRSLKADRKADAKEAHKRKSKRAPSTMHPEDEEYNNRADAADKLVAVVDMLDYQAIAQPDSYILFALLTGGDHNTGVMRVGPKHARRVCFPASKYATPLLDIFRNAKHYTNCDGTNSFHLKTWEQYELDSLLDRLFDEMKNDKEEEGRKMGKALADGALKGMPDHNVLHYYLYNCTIISKLPGLHRPNLQPPDIYSIWTYTKESGWPLKDSLRFITKLLLTWSLGPYARLNSVLTKDMIEIKGVPKTTKTWHGAPIPEKLKVQVHQFELIKAYLSAHQCSRLGPSGVEGALNKMMGKEVDHDLTIEMYVPRVVMCQCQFGRDLFDEFTQRKEDLKEKTQKQRARKGPSLKSKSMMENWLTGTTSSTSRMPVTAATKQRSMTMDTSFKSTSVRFQKETIPNPISTSSDTDSDEIEIINSTPQKPVKTLGGPRKLAKRLIIDELFSSDCDSPGRPVDTPESKEIDSRIYNDHENTPTSSQQPRMLSARSQRKSVSKSVNQLFESDSEEGEEPKEESKSWHIHDNSLFSSPFKVRVSPGTGETRRLGVKRNLPITPVKPERVAQSCIEPLHVEKLFPEDSAMPLASSHKMPDAINTHNPKNIASETNVQTTRPAHRQLSKSEVKPTNSTNHTLSIKPAPITLKNQKTLSFSLGINANPPSLAPVPPKPRRASKKSRSMSGAILDKTQGTLDRYFTKSSNKKLDSKDDNQDDRGIDQLALTGIGLDSTSSVFKASKMSFTTAPPIPLTESAMSLILTTGSGSEDEGQKLQQSNRAQNADFELEWAFEQHFQNISQGVSAAVRDPAIDNDFIAQSSSSNMQCQTDPEPIRAAEQTSSSSIQTSQRLKEQRLQVPSSPAAPASQTELAIPTTQDFLETLSQDVDSAMDAPQLQTNSTSIQQPNSPQLEEHSDDDVILTGYSCTTALDQEDPTVSFRSTDLQDRAQ